MGDTTTLLVVCIMLCSQKPCCIIYVIVKWIEESLIHIWLSISKTLYIAHLKLSFKWASQLQKQSDTNKWNDKSLNCKRSNVFIKLIEMYVWIQRLSCLSKWLLVSTGTWAWTTSLSFQHLYSRPSPISKNCEYMPRFFSSLSSC